MQLDISSLFIVKEKKFQKQLAEYCDNLSNFRVHVVVWLTSCKIVDCQLYVLELENKHTTNKLDKQTHN